MLLSKQNTLLHLFLIRTRDPVSIILCNKCKSVYRKRQTLFWAHVELYFNCATLVRSFSSAKLFFVMCSTSISSILLFQCQCLTMDHQHNLVMSYMMSINRTIRRIIIWYLFVTNELPSLLQSLKGMWYYHMNFYYPSLHLFHQFSFSSLHFFAELDLIILLVHIKKKFTSKLLYILL